MTKYLTDDDGDRWPVTGHWCAHCAMPLTPIYPDQTVHPWCANSGHSTDRDAITELTRQFGGGPAAIETAAE